MQIVVGAIVFLVSWIYAINEFGFFLGGSLGWIPSMFLGWIASLIATFVFVLVVAIFTRKNRE